ncbi:hypothetical protein HBI16_184610 [Parastagonospora nodorum]|nr:hypothetical protein HBI16_184610 [Parastagonospora nodorum]
MFSIPYTQKRPKKNRGRQAKYKHKQEPIDHNGATHGRQRDALSSNREELDEYEQWKEQRERT